MQKKVSQKIIGAGGDALPDLLLLVPGPPLVPDLLLLPDPLLVLDLLLLPDLLLLQLTLSLLDLVLMSTVSLATASAVTIVASIVVGIAVSVGVAARVVDSSAAGAGVLGLLLCQWHLLCHPSVLYQLFPSPPPVPLSVLRPLPLSVLQL